MGRSRSLFVYSTTRIVRIPNRCLGLTYILCVIAVIAYIGGYGMIWSKEYQVVSPVESVVVTKVKGVLSTITNDGRPPINVQNLGPAAVDLYNLYHRIWDASDVVVPAHGGENGGFFVLTDVVITPNQTRSTCPEGKMVEKAQCKTDRDCSKGQSLSGGNGIMTGRCVPYEQNIRTCEVTAWCPVEKDRTAGSQALLEGTKDFTVLVKNSIEFIGFGNSDKYRRRNIFKTHTREYLASCLYNSAHGEHKYCPTFRLGDIVAGVPGANKEDYSRVARTGGGVFAIRIKWSCDFDWGRSIDRHCLPEYQFSRMDNPETLVSPGFNFRSVVYHEENRRTLTHNYGIKFLVDVEGEGRMFDSVKFILAIGAGVGLFGLAAIICDYIFIFLCWLKEHVNWKCLKYYDQEMKFDETHVDKAERNRFIKNNRDVADTPLNSIEVEKSRPSGSKS